MGNIFNKESNKTQLELENELLKNRITELENLIRNNNNQKQELDKFYKDLDSSIDKYVNEMLQDEEINSVIPDYIEKKIYKNVFSLVIKLVKNITDSTSINFMGQELTLNINSKNR